MFLGNQLCYVFFRLHHTIYWRLVLAKRLTLRNLEPSVALKGDYDVNQFDDSDEEVVKSNGTDVPLYSNFISILLSLMDGSSDSAQYEDICRQLLSNKGYFVYTLDKVSILLLSFQ